MTISDQDPGFSNKYRPIEVKFSDINMMQRYQTKFTSKQLFHAWQMLESLPIKETLIFRIHPDSNDRQTLFEIVQGEMCMRLQAFLGCTEFFGYLEREQKK
ncbi:hypothetical protein ACBP93_00920 [Paenalcaligenes hominis]|uniref:hypothetical protein n=1 Tax=Paenalcaligenes hominis TaxID=643674 RepID=UPI0035257709